MNESQPSKVPESAAAARPAGAEPPKMGPPRPLSLDEVIAIRCPKCTRVHPRVARSILRGCEFICDGCQSTIEMGSITSTPLAKVRVANPIDETEAMVDLILRQDGAWVFLNEYERSVLDALDHDSDRAVAIIVGSMIEERLKRALLSNMERHKPIEERMFQPSGPLGPFSAKIDLAFLMGLISAEAHRDLAIFKDVRNAFAHHLNIQDFRSQAIRDKTTNLKLVHSYVSELPDGQSSVGLAPQAKPAVWVRGAIDRKRRARDRYLMTAQIFTVKLWPIDLPSWPLPYI